MMPASSVHRRRQARTPPAVYAEGRCRFVVAPPTSALPVEALVPVELCLRGSAVYDSKPTLNGIDEALPLAQRALQLNPDFVPAPNLKPFLLLNHYDEEAAPDHDRYTRELDALTARMLAIELSRSVCVGPSFACVDARETLGLGG